MRNRIQLLYDEKNSGIFEYEELDSELFQKEQDPQLFQEEQNSVILRGIGFRVILRGIGAFMRENSKLFYVGQSQDIMELDSDLFYEKQDPGFFYEG